MGPDYEIAGVCLSVCVCLSVIAPKVAILNSFDETLHSSLGSEN